MFSRFHSRLRARFVLRDLVRQRRSRAPVRNLPVLYVPGIFGTKLYDRQRQVYLWSDYRGLLFRQPGEAGFEIDTADPNRVLANETLHEFRLLPGLLSSIVTRDVANALEVGLGYRLGCDLFFLAYDWRDDYRRLGGLIEREIARIRAQFGQNQQVILIGQSVANQAIRYWLRESTPDMRGSIAKWYAFGPPWRGSWDAVHMLQHGYWPASRKHYGFSAEAVASCPSVYQLLPTESRLMDRHGEPIDGFDIFDASHWRDAGLPHGHPQLRGHLAQGRDFATAIAGFHPADADVPQTWFVNTTNQAVSYALAGGGDAPAATIPSEIRTAVPEIADRYLEIGDDHFPLRHITEAPCGPLVASLDAVPWGNDAVIISRARDHRALINHGPNLYALVKDLLALTQQPEAGLPN